MSAMHLSTSVWESGFITLGHQIHFFLGPKGKIRTAVYLMLRAKGVPFVDKTGFLKRKNQELSSKN